MNTFNRNILVLVFLSIYTVLVAQKKLEISHLTGNFYVYTTYNDYGGTLFPANGLYVLTDAGVLILDTPWDTSQCAPLLDSIYQKHKQNAVLCISTHSHEDRSGGLDIFKSLGLKTYSSQQTQQLCADNGNPQAAFYFTKDTTFQLGSLTFRTFYPGEGHTVDNQVVLFDKQKIVYGGCFIKSTEAKTLGYVGDANVKAWPESIKRLKKALRRPKYVVPGHQSWKNRRSIKHTQKLLQVKWWLRNYPCF